MTKLALRPAEVAEAIGIAENHGLSIAEEYRQGAHTASTWHCHHCHQDKPPDAFYCHEPPQCAAPAWWCRSCVHRYLRRRWMRHQRDAKAAA